MKKLNKILQYLDNQQIDIAEFERMANISNGYLRNTEKRRADVSQKILDRIEENLPEIYYGVFPQENIQSMPQPKTNILDQLIPLVAKSEYEFQKKIGAPNGTINNARKANSKLTDNLIRKIMKAYPQVSEHFLVTGEGDPIASNTTNNNDTPMEQDYRTKYERLLEKTNEQLSDAMSLIIQEMKEVKVSLDDSKTHFSRITAAQMELMEKIADRMGVSDLPTAPASAQPAYTGDSK